MEFLVIFIFGFMVVSVLVSEFWVWFFAFLLFVFCGWLGVFCFGVFIWILSREYIRFK